MFLSVVLLSALLSTALGCPTHDNYQSHPHLRRRQVRVNTDRAPLDWTYALSFDWATIKPAYELCHTGTHQSPINIAGLEVSENHQPSFDGYANTSIPGNLYNWGVAPAWTPNHGADITSLPSLTYDNQTVYLMGWHLHTPAEHLIDGERSRAEMHLVHITAENQTAAVVGIRLAVGAKESAFFAQFGQYIQYNDSSQLQGVEVNMRLVIDEVGGAEEFWTYNGSLTTPPCSEGIRWFLPRQELTVSDQQMVDILAASRYSHRVLQEVWDHDINV